MAQEYPLITIVTITFNLIKADREKTFRQCVESVYNQTYKNIEHIIIDGASTDGTLDLIQEYVDNGYLKYISEPDSGIYDAMNKGIKMAKGKYIAFLNSDDFYNNIDGIKLSVKALEESGADFSYAPVRMIDKLNDINYNHYHLAPVISNVFFTMPFCHQTMFTRRDILIKENMFNSKFKSAGDYDLVLRLSLKGYKSILVNDIFVTYRFGGLSDINQKQSIREVASSYFDNYSKLVNITKEECDKIYCNGYSNISIKLAEKLKDNSQYFNYSEYVKNKKIFIKIRNKIIFYYAKIIKILKLIIFHPKIFIRKFYIKFIKI